MVNPYRLWGGSLEFANGAVVCKLHPRYKKLRKPSGNCKACWHLWWIVELRK